MTQVVLASAVEGGVAFGVDLNDFDVSLVRGGSRSLVNAGLIRVTTSDGWTYEFTGSGFTQSGGQITGGTVTGFSASFGGVSFFTMTGASASAQTLFDANTSTDTFLTSLLSGPDTITTSSSLDQIWLGYSGDDSFTGGAGLDTFNGGPGTDTSNYASIRDNYTIKVSAGGVEVSAKAGAPGGQDFLVNVERLVFSDRTIDLTKADATFAAGAGRVLRSVMSQDLELDLANGRMTRAEAVTMLVDQADTTSSVATLAYQFFTGAAPSSNGMDYLVKFGGDNPNNLNSGYYQSFSLENRYINFAVNLGKLGEGSAKFTADYGGLALWDATRKAYTQIFGGNPSDAKLSALLDASVTVSGVTMTRSQYFQSYGLDGPNGQGTKAAMVGWLLGEAAKADIGVYALSNEAFLADVANNNAAFAVNIVGVYSKPEYVYNPG